MPTRHLGSGSHDCTVVTVLDACINIACAEVDPELKHDGRAAKHRDFGYFSCLDKQFAHFTKCRLNILPGKLLNHVISCAKCSTI
jgi:hypothetical protein